MSEPAWAEWAAYNASRAVRDLRPLSARLIELAGPGEGRTAVDIGCGAGVEVAALARLPRDRAAARLTPC